MSRRMQLQYKAYVTAFLQTDFFLEFLFFCVQWRSDVNWFPWESHSREIRSKNKSGYENAVTGM